MMTKRPSSSVDLTEAYRQAQVKVLSSLYGTNPQTIRLNFTKTLQTVVTSLDTANAKAVEQSVTDGIRASQRSFVSNLSSIFDGRAFTVKDLSAIGLNVSNQRAAADVLDRKAQYVKDTAEYRQNFLELRNKLVGVSRALQGEVNSTLQKLSGKAENTIVNAIGELRDKLKAQGCFNVQYSNGASVGVDKYATMVCRSARTESANAENLRIAKTFGTDLVECVGNAVTCDVCAQFRSRVFCVSGDDKRYPPLRDGVNSPLKNGYDLIHPNCRCEFRAYFEALHSEEEKEAKRKFSNRPFEGDKRTAEQARAYQEWQTINRRAIDEQSRWNEMAAVLGKDMPYADIGALRRALRSPQDSFAYKKSHYAVRDYKQYRRWTRRLSRGPYMPKSLADFQDLKYNKIDKFEVLKRENRTISKIEHKDKWTPKFKEKTIEEYYFFRQNGIEFSEHGIARCVQRQQTHGIKKDDIIELSKRGFDYYEEDNKLIKQWNGLVLVYSSETNEIVTVEKRKTVKSTWRKYDK